MREVSVQGGCFVRLTIQKKAAEISRELVHNTFFTLALKSLQPPTPLLILSPALPRTISLCRVCRLSASLP